MVALEDRHRAYREAIADAIGAIKTHLTVTATSPESLAEEVVRLEPFLVICDRPNTFDPDGGTAWIELSLEPSQATRAYLYGRRRELTNPTLEELVELVSEAERLAPEEGGRKSW